MSSCILTRIIFCNISRISIFQFKTKTLFHTKNFIFEIHTLKYTLPHYIISPRILYYVRHKTVNFMVVTTCKTTVVIFLKYHV